MCRKLGAPDIAVSSVYLFFRNRLRTLNNLLALIVRRMMSPRQQN
jgi:hypothetical protein